MNAIELFAGAGGLGMGISMAGFKHSAVIERDDDCCRTIRFNQQRKVVPLNEWPLHQADVCTFDFKTIKGTVDLVAGGPPCQPFSLGGKHLGPQDNRDMFPQAVRVVRELKPKVFLFENVKGLLRESFAKYYQYILLQLQYPELSRKKEEDWFDHLGRLSRYHTKGVHDGLHYRVLFHLLNAADYGVPQKRERVFIVGFRSDLSFEWSFPAPTHTQKALLWTQWKTEDYWERHRIPKAKRPAMPRIVDTKLFSRLSLPAEKPWLTTRDAISDLPSPEKATICQMLNHRFIPGARSYPGHTGSPLDEPAKTLKAGDHGVPGGENMLAFPDGRVRYFTLRESARLQCFPDNYAFCGSWTESMRQLGNAVPTTLAHVVAKHIYKYLSDRN